MIITISGTPGSGKSTLGKLLAKKLGYEFFSVGDLRGELAMERGMTIEEYNKLGETEDTDTEADNKVREFGKRDKVILDGRMGYHFIPHSFKIFIDAELKERAKRIFNSDREDEKYETLEETEKGMATREKSDTKRFQRLYQITWNDKNNFDIVLDSTNTGPEELAEQVIQKIKNRNL